jgi:hypothetical protein
VREKASRIRPVGSAVTAPTPAQGDEADGEVDDEDKDDVACRLPGCPRSMGCCAPASASLPSPGGTGAGAGPADPRPAMARLASVAPPLRASSIIPSKRPRIETPRRAASASTQARRSWSRRMPTTVDLEVAMAPLTVIRGVYISGAEWWQPGGGHRGGIASGLAQARSAADPGRRSTGREIGAADGPATSTCVGSGAKSGSRAVAVRTAWEPPSDGAAATGDDPHPGTSSAHHALEVQRQAGRCAYTRDPLEGRSGAPVRSTPGNRRNVPAHRGVNADHGWC